MSKEIPGYVSPEFGSGGGGFGGGVFASYSGDLLGVGTADTDITWRHHMQPPTNTKTALEKGDDKGKDKPSNPITDPLLRRPTTLEWGGSNDAITNLNNLGRQILAKLPEQVGRRPAALTKAAAKRERGQVTSGGGGEVDSLLASLDVAPRATSSGGRGAVAIPTPVPDSSSGGSGLGLMLAVLGILVTIGAVVYYEYKHKKHD
jgi:hypothetical protein